jgi:hypothetical protein
MIGETGAAGQLARSRFQAIREHCIVPVPIAANAPFALQQYARESAENRRAGRKRRLNARFLTAMASSFLDPLPIFSDDTAPARSTW